LKEQSVSGLDQALLIATCGYHVGHQRSIRIAEEQGYFKEEGFTSYVYDYRGLIPGPFERAGLALAMKEHGVDVACGANVESAILQRAGGADLFIVGGWRYTTRPKFVSAKGITRFDDLRGKRIGLREFGGLSDRFIRVNLLRAGLDPDKDVLWVMDPVFAYTSTPDHAEMLRAGKVDVIWTNGSYARQLVAEGFHLLLDGGAPERRRRPGRVIVATQRTIEQRAQELSAFLKANVRAFWFAGDQSAFDAVYELETRMRRDYTHNEDERTLRIFNQPRSLTETLMPLDGAVDADQLDLVIEEMRDLGELTVPLAARDVLRGDIMASAFAELSARPALQTAMSKVREVAAAP